MRFLIIVLTCMALAGCPWNVKQDPVVQTVYEKVEVPVLVPCQIPPVEKPVDLVAGLKKEDDLFYKVKILLADLQLRIPYETKLETAITSCNRSE